MSPEQTINAAEIAAFKFREFVDVPPKSLRDCAGA